MSILDKANDFIGHPREIDEGYETSMRRAAYICGYEDAFKNAFNWLKANANEYVVTCYDRGELDDEGMLMDFCKVMEE